MAKYDYRLCDICKEETFYDADLDYYFGDKEKSCRNGGEVIKGQELVGLGDWVVICNICAEKYEITINQKANK